MAKPQIQVEDRAGYRLVRFQIPGGVTTPEEFAEAVREVEKSLPGPLPVLLWGRGPIWGYGMLIHAAHPTPMIGCWDPRGAVDKPAYIVVASHDVRWKVGDKIPTDADGIPVPK
jgi:CRISPR-associated protein Csx3